MLDWATPNFLGIKPQYKKNISRRVVEAYLVFGRPLGLRTVGMANGTCLQIRFMQ